MLHIGERRGAAQPRSQAVLSLNAATRCVDDHAALATDSDHVWLGARRSYADPDRSPTDMPVEAGPDAAVWQVEPIACERIGEVSTDLGPFGLAVY